MATRGHRAMRQNFKFRVAKFYKMVIKICFFIQIWLVFSANRQIKNRFKFCNILKRIS